MKSKHSALAVVLLLIITAVAVWQTTRPPLDPARDPARDSAESTDASPAMRAGKNEADGRPAGAPDGKFARPSPSTAGSGGDAPRVTKVRDREKPDFDARRLTTVDMTLPPDEASPQAGPRLFAELRTLSMRHVNLAPNHLGIMPRIRVAPRESVLVTLSLPESSPGDRIHAELSDGGRFTDSDKPGGIYTVGLRKTVEIRFEASEQRGHCNLELLQAGHNRTLPLWVGAPQESASGDPQ